MVNPLWTSSSVFVCFAPFAKGSQFHVRRAGQCSRVFLIILSLAFTYVANAQYVPSAATATGVSPFSVYQKGEVDNVNIVNGNLFVQIPILSYPQRGKALKLNFNIYYNDKQWYINNFQTHESSSGNTYSGQWAWKTYDYGPALQPVSNVGAYVARDQHLDFGYDRQESYIVYDPEPWEAYTTTTDLDGYYVRESNGAKHYYRDIQWQTCTGPGQASCPPTYSGYGSSYPATDASGYLPINLGDDNHAVPVQIIDADGVTYTALNYSETVADLNGNSISTSSSGWTDSIGRQIPGSYDLPGTSDNYDPSSPVAGKTIGIDPVPGLPVSPGSTPCPSGTTAARRWDVPAVQSSTATYYLCYTQKPFQSAFNIHSVINSGIYDAVDEGSSTTSSFTPTILSAVILPNGTSYTFAYDQYLSLTQLTLPTGGSISYTWQNIANPLRDIDLTVPVMRVIQRRTVNPGNGAPSQTWTYRWIASQVTNALGDTVPGFPMWDVVTDPAGNDTEYQLGNSGITSPLVETSRVYYSGCGPHDTSSDAVCSPASGTILQSEIYTLSGIGSGGASTGSPSSQATFSLGVKTGIDTIVPTANGDIRNRVVISYSPSYGTCNYYYSMASTQQPRTATLTPCYSINQEQGRAFYNFGVPGSQNPGGLLRTETTNYKWQEASSPYLAANLMNLVSSSIITDAAGNKAAETDYGYDESGSPQGQYGNLTSTTRWENVGASPKTTMVYNAQGMATQTGDPKGNITKFTYDATGAFLKQIEHPVVNNIQHIDQFTFDGNTGLMTSHTDQNGNLTTYSYSDPITNTVDPLNRLHQITYPSTTDGATGSAGSGYKRYTYNDTTGSLSVTEQDLQSAVESVVTRVSQFDGLGRIIHSSDAYTVDTTYDLLGRIHTVTNPYSSTSDSTYGITSYTYDALGRKTLQIQPDGSKLWWCYDGIASSGQPNCLANTSSSTGTWVDFSDESGRHWQRVSDAFDRLVAVMEPDASSTPRLETDYSYNSLSNLTSAVVPLVWTVFVGF